MDWEHMSLTERQRDLVALAIILRGMIIKPDEYVDAFKAIKMYKLARSLTAMLEETNVQEKDE